MFKKISAALLALVILCLAVFAVGCDNGNTPTESNPDASVSNSQNGSQSDETPLPTKLNPKEKFDYKGFEAIWVNNTGTVYTDNDDENVKAAKVSFYESGDAVYSFTDYLSKSFYNQWVGELDLDNEYGLPTDETVTVDGATYYRKQEFHEIYCSFKLTDTEIILTNSESGNIAAKFSMLSDGSYVLEYADDTVHMGKIGTIYK